MATKTAYWDPHTESRQSSDEYWKLVSMSPRSISTLHLNSPTISSRHFTLCCGAPITRNQASPLILQGVPATHAVLSSTHVIPLVSFRSKSGDLMGRAYESTPGLHGPSGSPIGLKDGALVAVSGILLRISGLLARTLSSTSLRIPDTSQPVTH